MIGKIEGLNITSLLNCIDFNWLKQRLDFILLEIKTISFLNK